MSVAEVVGDEEIVEEEKERRSERQQARLKRKECNNQDNTSWRPKKRYRVSSFHWLAMLDQQAGLLWRGRHC